MTQKQLFIIEGIIGSGKTTLINNIKKICHNDIIVFEEPIEEFCNLKYNNNSKIIEENILQLCYENPKKYAFANQLNILTSIINQLLNFNNNEKQIGIMERSLLSAVYVFSKYYNEFGYIENREYGILMKYIEIFFNIVKNYKVHFIFLNTTLDNSFERIKNRNRRAEQNININLLQELSSYYNQFKIKLTCSNNKRIKDLNIFEIDGNNNKEMVFKDFLEYIHL